MVSALSGRFILILISVALCSCSAHFNSTLIDYDHLKSYRWMLMLCVLCATHAARERERNGC